MNNRKWLWIAISLMIFLVCGVVFTILGFRLLSWNSPKTVIGPTPVPQTIAQSNDAIAAELAKYGYTMQNGQEGWLQTSPLTLRADKQNSPYEPLLKPNPNFSNFILSVDIDWGIWKDDGNLGGCGIFFDGHNNFEGEMLYFAAGHFPTTNNWNVTYWDPTGAFQGLLGPNGKLDSNILQGNNHYILLVNNRVAAFYANDNELGKINLPDGLSEGQIALVAWSNMDREGISNCTFTNGWLWKLP